MIQGWRPIPALPRHPHPLLPLLPSGPDGVHNFASRGDRYRPPLYRYKLYIFTLRETSRSLFDFGGERGIRTLDTLLTYTHFPGVRLKPLGHLSRENNNARRVNKKNYSCNLCCLTHNHIENTCPA